MKIEVQKRSAYDLQTKKVTGVIYVVSLIHKNGFQSKHMTDFDEAVDFVIESMKSLATDDEPWRKLKPDGTLGEVLDEQ